MTDFAIVRHRFGDHSVTRQFAGRSGASTGVGVGQGWLAGLAGLVARIPTLVVPMVAGCAGLVAGAYGGAPLRGAAGPAVAMTVGALWAGGIGGLGTLGFGLLALGAARAMQVDGAGRRALARAVAIGGCASGFAGLAGATVGGWAGAGGQLDGLGREAGILLWMSLPAPAAGMLLAAALWLTSLEGPRGQRAGESNE